jgi:hypothetical protein
VHIALDPAFERIPLGALDAFGEGGDLKVVLNVNREGVGDAFGYAVGGASGDGGMGA